jgi:hypothetical protein
MQIVSMEIIDYSKLSEYIMFYNNDIKKIGLLLSVLVSYIFILCSYFRGVNASKIEILAYIILE